MQSRPLLGINGRLRRHITKVGAAHANRISSPKKMLTDDDYLRGLVHGSRVTQEQLEKAIDEYNRVPSNFAWMQKVEDSILDRADDVFLVKYGRDPTEDADFRLNGDYYKICKNLERNWHYYNAELEKLRWDYQRDRVYVDRQATPIVRTEPAVLIRSNKALPAFAFLTTIYLGGVWALHRFYIDPNYRPEVACLSFWGFFLGVFPLMVLWGRIIPEFRCSNCRRGYNRGAFGGVPRVCKRCGVKFR